MGLNLKSVVDGSWLKGGTAFMTSGLEGVAQAAFNQAEAGKQRDFQKYMSNTSYRRAAYDMEKAGLNRILALGSPATTPSGAKAEIDKPNMTATGIAAASAKQQIEQSKAQERLIENQQSLIAEQTRSAKATADMDEVKKGIYTALKPALETVFKGIGESATSSAKFLEKLEAPDLINFLGDWGFEGLPEGYFKDDFKEKPPTIIKKEPK